MFDFRAVPGAGYTVSNDQGAGKHVTTTALGSIVTMQVFGRVSGTNGLNDEAMQLAAASVASSTGGLLGNLQHFTLAPFTGSGSANGVQNDFDSDGDLDVGSTGTSATGKIAYRSAVATAINVPNGATVLDANTAEILVGTLTFTLTGSGSSTVIQVIPRGGTTSGVAQWQEDGISTAKTPGTGTFGAISPGVVIDLGPLDLYWDTNGSSVGAGGPTPAGTWGADNFWNADVHGTVATGTWASGTRAHFAAGTDAGGSYSVIVAGTQTASSLYFEEGTLTLTGGQVNLWSGIVEVTSSGVATIASVIGGTAGLTKTGTGTLTLSGANTYSGVTTISTGTLSVSADNNLGAGGALSIAGGTFATSASFSTSRTIQFSTGSGAIEVAGATTLGITGIVNGTGALIKSGPGTLVPTGTIVHSGGTTVTGGRIAISTNGKLGSGPLTLNGGGLRLDAGFSFDSSGPTILGPAGGTIDTQGFNVNLIQPVTGSGGLTKTGSGTLTLLNASSYSGATAITNGKLSLVSSLSSGSLINSGQLASNGTTVTFSAASTNNSGGKINLIDSTLNIGAGASKLTNAGRINLIDVTVNGDIHFTTGGIINTAGDVTFNGSITGGGMLEAGGGTTQLSPGGNKIIVADTMTVDGKLDLADHRMIVRSTPLGSWTGSDYTGVTGLVRAGRGDGTWNADGITTSQSSATSGTGYTSLGVARASEARSISPSATDTWCGQIVTGSDTLIMYTYGGDADLSGTVDADDYGQIDFNTGIGGSLPGWFNGDFDYSGSVDADDYGIIDFVINIQVPPFMTGGGAMMVVQTVPEPASFLPFAAVGALCSRRRLRRKRATAS